MEQQKKNFKIVSGKKTRVILPNMFTLIGVCIGLSSIKFAFDEKFTKVSIFMNVFDCHVNRTPCSGKISQIIYRPGKFINASLDKSSEENERNYYKIQNSLGEDIVVVQIAGLIARRIVCESSENQDIKQGERIGMIRFGSRADVYFENYKPLVKVNQKTVAGETLLAKKQ